MTSIKNHTTPGDKNMNRTTLFFIILLEGFITIAIEILSIRQMVPFVGSNILNTSIILGIFLLSLSIGYYRGGLVNDGFQKVLLSNLTKTFFFVSFGLSYMFLYYLFGIFESLIGLIVFSLFIMAPTVFYLGQTIPILTNLVKNERNGKISGQLLFASTFGSFVGSLVTSVVLLNYLGANAAIIVVILLLIALIILLAWQEQVQFVRTMIAVAIMMPIVVVANTNYLFIKTNNYSNIRVADVNDTKYLIINNSFSSGFNKKTGMSDFEYIKTIQAYIKSLNAKDPKNILVLGAGGFTLSLNDNTNKYTYVDIDKDLKEVAEKAFLDKKINGKFVIDDGRHFLIKNREKFDIVVVDVYSNKNSIPSSFVTADFYNKVGGTLSKDGVLIVNTISSPLFRDPYSRKLNHSILESFDCHVSPTSNNLMEFQNIIYACSAKNNNDSEPVYTDNLTNLFELAKLKKETHE
jgi:spermidine synthase